MRSVDERSAAGINTTDNYLRLVKTVLRLIGPIVCRVRVSEKHSYHKVFIVFSYEPLTARSAWKVVRACQFTRRHHDCPF